jgi:hypothetical protein
MKNILLLAFPIILMSSCKVSHFEVSRLKDKYDTKMDRNATDKYKSLDGRKYEVKRPDLKNRVDLYFSESEIKRPFKVIDIAAWNPINFRVLVPFLPFFTKKHVINQSMRRAALITAAASGDGAIITNNPTQYQIISYTDGKGRESVNTKSPVVTTTRSTGKEKKQKTESKEPKEGIFKSIFKKKD